MQTNLEFMNTLIGAKMKFGDFAIGFYPQCPKCKKQITVDTECTIVKGGCEIHCDGCYRFVSIPFPDQAEAIKSLTGLAPNDEDRDG
jgi:hypothetical protein